MSIYAFGDIHGEYDKLLSLIKKLNLDYEDTLIFLGDYIDRGEKSFEVITYLCYLARVYKCIFLRGNHELMLRDYMVGKDYRQLYLYNGGGSTIKSYEKHGFIIAEDLYNIPKTHLEFIQHLKPYYETEDYIFVHAGIDPDIELKDTPDEILYWDRNFNYINYKGPKIVVYGHTPFEEVLNEKYKVCIDTGACYKSMGILTCIKLPERMFIQQKTEDRDDQ